MMDNFFKNKKVLITGHNGFKGKWLSYWLNKLGANVYGISLPIQKSKYDKFCLNNIIEYNNDIRYFDKIKNSIIEINPQIVFHLAAQPIVLNGYKNPIYTYQTNIIGTINVLQSLKLCKNIKSILIVTTDKVYRNDNDKKIFSEQDKLGGYDPYSASKSCVQIIVESYKRSFFEKIGLGTARSGNVIGGGDFGQYRIIPDIVKSTTNKKTVIIRNPYYTRPFQHVLDSLYGYFLLSKHLYYNNLEINSSWNFGPKSEISVIQLVTLMQKYWNDINYQIDNNCLQLKQSKTLMLNSQKSIQLLGWKQNWDIEKSCKYTANWYKKYFYDNKIMSMFDIESYIETI